MKIKEEKKIIFQSIINKSVNKKEASIILIIKYNGSTEQQQKEACDVNKLKWEKGSHWMNQREPLHSSHNTERKTGYSCLWSSVTYMDISNPNKCCTTMITWL